MIWHTVYFTGTYRVSDDELLDDESPAECAQRTLWSCGVMISDVDDVTTDAAPSYLDPPTIR